MPCQKSVEVLIMKAVYYDKYLFRRYLYNVLASHRKDNFLFVCLSVRMDRMIRAFLLLFRCDILKTKKWLIFNLRILKN